MHENLKTTVSLRPEDNKKNIKDNWQILIPDYYSNTFYVLYGRFRGQLDRSKFKPESCDLYIQNYQGIVTIGLVPTKEIEVDIAYDESINAPVYVLKVHLKALHANEELPNVSLKILKEPSIAGHDYYHQNQTFQSLVTDTIDCNFRMRVEIIYDPIEEKYFNKTKLEESRLIDAREFKRDGDQLTNIGLNVYNPTKKKFQRPKHLEGHHIHEKNMIKSGVLVDKRCNPKYVKLLT